MVLNKEKFTKAISDLRKAEAERHKQRTFDQTVDIIINLKDFDPKRNGINLVLDIPHKFKDKKMAGFLENKSNTIDTITKDEFANFKDKAKLKKLVNEYDFFIASAKLMPAVATTFGRVLGPAGKMPSPQLGIVVNVDDKIIQELKNKVNTSVKLRVKEASIKLPVGKQSMDDKDILENVMSIYNALIKVLPRDKENVKNIEIKYTMSKPQKVGVR